MTAGRIIVVEDESILALHLRKQLSKLGYEVVAVAASGETALRKIAELRPDMVLMDIHIDGKIDGIETATRIPAEFGIAVIYVTAYADESTLERARSTTPYGYLVKPFSERDLHATLQMALERRRTDSALRKSQQKLRLSEERFRSIFGAVSEGIWSVAADLDETLYLNPASERIYGRSASAFFADPKLFMNIVHPEDRPPVAQMLPDLIEKGTMTIQYRIVRPDGEMRWLEDHTAIARDADGRPARFDGVASDITERKRLEERFRRVVEAAPDAMLVVNQGGEIVLLNLQAEKEFGYRRDELLGQKVKNIIPEGFAERLVADGLRTAEDALTQQIGAGIELSGRRKDGSEFPIEIMLSPLESAAGTLVTAAIRNISVRKAAEKHLAQMEGRYRALLEAAPDAMLVVNQGGEIVLLNRRAEKEFGYRRDELLGQKVKNIIPEGFAERLVADGLRTAEDALTQQIGAGIELSGRRKDGSEFPIEIMLSPLESAAGTLVTAAIRNISVRKAAEKHLAQMEGRYRALLEAAPDATLVVNQGGEIVLLNLQAEKEFGYRRDELLGQKVK